MPLPYADNISRRIQCYNTRTIFDNVTQLKFEKIYLISDHKNFIKKINQEERLPQGLESSFWIFSEIWR